MAMVKRLTRYNLIRLILTELLGLASGDFFGLDTGHIRAKRDHRPGQAQLAAHDQQRAEYAALVLALKSADVSAPAR